jgi:hypothetical protein
MFYLQHVSHATIILYSDLCTGDFASRSERNELIKRLRREKVKERREWRKAERMIERKKEVNTET